MTQPQGRPKVALEIVALTIFDKYRRAYDGEVQGCCPLVADEIQRALGGEVVAGEIVYLGSMRRTHWWVEVEGHTIDPMGDAMFAPEDFAKHVEVHRDRATFEAILPDYEQWRVEGQPRAEGRSLRPED